MTHIKINKREFESLLGEEIEDSKLQQKGSMLGAHWSKVDGDKWDVEVYPDRPDLLSVEGLARAYQKFFDTGTKTEKPSPEHSGITLSKDPELDNIRPVIGCAIVENVQLDERAVNGIVQLQEKLHKTLGREREKVAIGLHDTAEIEPPFKYRASEPEETEFIPLGEDRELNLNGIIENHEKGSEYGSIVEGYSKYPVIVDSNGTPLSFPPIINNKITEVDESTRDLFVDITGTDKKAVQTALNIVTLALHMRDGDIKQVEVEGKKQPDYQRKELRIEEQYISDTVGVDVDANEIEELLEKMDYKATAEEENAIIDVAVPSYRQDVLHRLDVAEDVAIAYGYNNISGELPGIPQIGKEKNQESLKRNIRNCLLGQGTMEAHTHILSSEEKQYGKMEKQAKPDYVSLSNPLNENYSMVRTSIMPELLRSISKNKHETLPQSFFEISTVTHPESDGGEEKLRLSYVKTGKSVDYNDVKSVIQAVERDTKVSIEVKSSEDSSFKDGRSAALQYNGRKLGIIGEINQDVLDNWQIEQQAAGFELDLDPFYSEQ
jgi:phenylalanyl-tRNA synthetase beta chain